MSDIGKTLTPEYKEVLHITPARSDMVAVIWSFKSDIDSVEIVKVDFIACVKKYGEDEFYFLPFVWNPEMYQFTDMEEYMETAIANDDFQYEMIHSEKELSELLDAIQSGIEVRKELEARKEREANGD